MPLLPRIGPGEVVPLRQVRPDDVGGGAGQAAFAGATSDLAAITSRLIGAERQADVARAEVGYGAKLGELAQTIDQDPDVDAREAKFEEARKAIANEFRSSLRGSQYQADFDQRAFQLGERAKLAVREGVIRKRLDNARGGVIESVDKFDRMIEHAESDQLRNGYVFARSNILEAGVSSGAISAAERAQIEKRSRAALEDADRQQSSLRITESIVSAGGSLSSQLAKARKDLGDGDPQLLKLVEGRLKDMSAEREFQKKKAEEEQLDKDTKRAYSLGSDKLTHEELARRDMGHAERASLESIIAARDTAVNGKVKTHEPTFRYLDTLFSDPRRQEEAEAVRLTDFAGLLSQENFDQLKARQFAPDPQRAMINAEIARHQKMAIYKDATPANNADRIQGEQYAVKVDRAIDRKRQELGRKALTDEEIRDVLDGQLKEVVDEGWLFDDEKRVFEVDREFAESVDVPTSDQARLRDALRELGVANPTEDDLREAYLDEQGVQLDDAPRRLPSAYNLAWRAIGAGHRFPAWVSRALAGIGIDNPDGTRSSVYTFSYEQDGITYVAPSVRETADGLKVLDENEALQAAREYQDGIPFASREAADEWSRQFSDSLGRMRR